MHRSHGESGARCCGGDEGLVGERDVPWRIREDPVVSGHTVYGSSHVLDAFLAEETTCPSRSA